MSYLEAIRKLRIRIMKDVEKKEYQTLLVTSSIPGEGKTTLSANLAISIAQQGKKVLTGRTVILEIRRLIGVE